MKNNVSQFYSFRLLINVVLTYVRIKFVAMIYLHQHVSLFAIRNVLM